MKDVFLLTKDVSFILCSFKEFLIKSDLTLKNLVYTYSNDKLLKAALNKCSHSDTVKESFSLIESH